MKETWLPVVGFEKYYLVSDLGNIKSAQRDIVRRGYKTYVAPEKIRKQVLNKVNGYLYVVLQAEGVHKTVPVHRIVAEAFCKNEEMLECVNHKNEIKTDNRAENLEWCSKAYNNTYNGKAQRCCKPVERIDVFTGKVTLFQSARMAAEKTKGTNYKNISSACRSKRNKCGGYFWRFANV